MLRLRGCAVRSRRSAPSLLNYASAWRIWKDCSKAYGKPSADDRRPVSDPIVIPATLIVAGLGLGIGALLGTLVREWAVIYEVP